MAFSTIAESAPSGRVVKPPSDLLIERDRLSFGLQNKVGQIGESRRNISGCIQYGSTRRAPAKRLTLRRRGICDLSARFTPRTGLWTLRHSTCYFQAWLFV